MGIGAILGLVLLSAAGNGATDTYLVAGRVRIAHEESEASARAPNSHRFELTVTYREGRFVSADLCLFAPLAESDGWNGTCLHPEPAHMTAAFEPAAYTKAVEHIDPAAQKLLRFLVSETYRHLPGDRRVAGFDLDAPLEVRHERSTPAATP